MATQKQRAAARSNVDKAQKGARKKQTLKNLPKSTQKALGQEAAAVRRGDSPTRKELEAEARKLGIDGRSKMGKDELKRAGADAGAKIRAQARKEDQEAVDAMRKRGLTVNSSTPELEAEWRALAEDAYPKIRGRMVPADLFDRVQALVQNYRAHGGKTAAR